jgi:hypothetical protein
MMTFVSEQTDEDVLTFASTLNAVTSPALYKNESLRYPGSTLDLTSLGITFTEAFNGVADTTSTAILAVNEIYYTYVVATDYNGIVLFFKDTKSLELFPETYTKLQVKSTSFTNLFNTFENSANLTFMMDIKITNTTATILNFIFMMGGTSGKGMLRQFYYNSTTNIISTHHHFYGVSSAITLPLNEWITIGCSTETPLKSKIYVNHVQLTTYVHENAATSLTPIQEPLTRWFTDGFEGSIRNIVYYKTTKSVEFMTNQGRVIDTSDPDLIVLWDGSDLIDSVNGIELEYA